MNHFSPNGRLAIRLPVCLSVFLPMEVLDGRLKCNEVIVEQLMNLSQDNVPLKYYIYRPTFQYIPFHDKG